ncbi:DUF6328 family protein [Cellulomonas massiliensis]|uniref:DUF6328 family protein n=1 Tax=Cellulomonas massiliensis TaxID=1465811 RepID=UPI0002F86B6F|nr:DUF6328 family protein [Cellulomonas massiliensis]
MTYDTRGRDAVPGDGRDETVEERMDRNWNELLQELRVTQTGATLLTGFLMTIPFQQRFEDLDDYQRTLYLVLVVLTVLATALILAPVSLHRELFRRRMKPQLVSAGNLFARLGLVVLALALVGVASLLFDVVVSRQAGQVVGATSAAVLVLVWWVLPRLVAGAAQRGAED